MLGLLNGQEFVLKVYVTNFIDFHGKVSTYFYWTTIYLCAVWLTNDELNFKANTTQKFNFQNMRGNAHSEKIYKIF